MGRHQRNLARLVSRNKFAKMVESSSALRTYRASVVESAPGGSMTPATHEAFRASSGIHIYSDAAAARSHLPAEGVGGLYANRELSNAPCVVGKRQSMWIDDDSTYCTLCAAPLDRGRSYHMGFDRDHIALNGFFFLSVMFPRTWHPAAVHHRILHHGGGFSRSLARFALPGCAGGRELTLDVANPVPLTQDDHQRIAAMRAVMLHLAEGPTPMRVLASSLFDDAAPGSIGHGEKIFRATVGELVVALLPPLGPNIHAAFAQKAWGRTNLMRLYDRLRLGEFQARYGLKPKKDRSDKSAVVRQMIVELSCAAETHANHPVACELAELLLHQLAFEAVVLKSAQYMNQAQQAVALAGYPSPSQLADLDVL